MCHEPERETGRGWAHSVLTAHGGAPASQKKDREGVVSVFKRRRGGLGRNQRKDTSASVVERER